MPQPFRYDEARRQEIARALIEARKEGHLGRAKAHRSAHNVPWKLLERRFGLCRRVLWKMLKETLAQREKP
jgi:hypothetical protein